MIMVSFGPRTAAGKLQKSVLRKTYGEGNGRKI